MPYTIETQGQAQPQKQKSGYTIDMISPRGGSFITDAGDPRIPGLKAKGWKQVEKPPLPWLPKSGADVGRALETGIRKGATGFISGPTAIASWLGEKIEPGAEAVARTLGIERGKPLFEGGPTAEQHAARQHAALQEQMPEAMERRTEEVTRIPFHEPGSRLEQGVQTGGEIISNIAGPGGPLRRLASVGLPAGASELADWAAKGTWAEPYARFFGLLGGGTVAAGKGTIKQPPSPSVEELKAQTSRTYEAAERSGVVFPADRYDQLVERVGTVAAKEGADPDLTKKAVTAIKRLDAETGTAKSVEDMDRLRKKVAVAAGSKNASEARIGKLMRQEFDEAYRTMAPPELAKARKLTQRYKRGEVLEEAQRRAPIRAGQLSQSGLENALRTEYRQIAMNPNRMREFTPAQQRLITEVATGGKAARGVGKWAPTGVVPTTAGLYLSQIFKDWAQSPGGSVATLGIPAAVGAAGRARATARTQHAVREAEFAAKSDPAELEAYLQRLHKKKADVKGRRAIQLLNLTGRAGNYLPDGLLGPP